MRKELPDELRQLADSLGPEFVNPGLPREAADEIERLQRQVSELKNCLSGISRQTAEMVRANP